FARIAHGGWLGLAESFMAGEWSTPDSATLVKVLTRLLEVDYNPATKAVSISESFGGELPDDLVALYSGDGLSHHGGLFASGAQVGVQAAARRATVDVVSSDDAHLKYLHEQLVLEGVEDSVACIALAKGIPNRMELRSRYEAIVSIEKLEALSPKQRQVFI